MMTGKTIVGSEDYSCAISHNPHGPWWQQTPSLYWGEMFVYVFDTAVLIDPFLQHF
jgi:hypothetical protein